MNKLLIYLIFFTLTCIGCKSQINIPSSNGSFSEESIVYWRNNNVQNQSIPMNSISVVKENFKILKGKLFNITKKEIVSNIKLVLIVGDSKGEDVKVLNGLPYGGYCDFTDGVTCKKDILYNEKGNLNGYFSVNDYNTTFRDGSGYWKDFYSTNKNKYSLKEEGEVKNNFKFGEWKYYTKKGKIHSVKTYTLKDSVDVRFPHCIFNKNEPCY